jgi:G:T-mismatch repair DNA endonuclease (very short patch repair protein)
MKSALFEGRMGSGKSLTCTAYAYPQWLSGRTIVANYNLFFMPFFIQTCGDRDIRDEQDEVQKYGLTIPRCFDLDFFIDHLTSTELSNSLILFDEAYLYMDARNSGSRMNKLFSWFLAQTRKRHNNLSICTLHWDQIDKRLRRAATKRVLCFPYGTKVLAECVQSSQYGKYKIERAVPIEDIGVGMRVLSYNEKTGEKEFKKVVEVHDRDARSFVKFGFSNGNELECTSEHPIAVNRNGKIIWTRARDLEIGDECIQKIYGSLSLKLSSIGRRGRTREKIFGKEISDKITSAVVKSHIGKPGMSGDNNPAKRPEVIFKISESHKKIWENNPRRRKAFSETKKKQWADQNSIYHSEEFVEGRRKRAIEQYQNNPNCGIRKEQEYKIMNRPERGLSYLLRNLCPGEFKYNGNGRQGFNIFGHYPDFVNVNGKKKIIEINGCYWHACHKCGFGERVLKDGTTVKETRNRDSINIARASSLGYQTLTIWEHEFGDMVKVHKKVSDFLFNPRTEIVKIVSIDKYYTHSRRVRNLEVEDNNNYFAEGILAHNCRFSKKTHYVHAWVIDLKTGERYPRRVFGPDFWSLYNTDEVIPIHESQIWLPESMDGGGKKFK